MKNLAFMLCALLALTSCGDELSCADPRVLAKLNNRFLQADTIVTLTRDTNTGNIKCHAKIEGALAYDGLDYSVMQTSSGNLVVESEMTGRIM